MDRERYQAACETLQKWIDSLFELSPPWDEYELMAVKPVASVWDSEDLDFYAWYFDKTENQYIFMYGMGTPDRDYADWIEEDFLAAHNWFSSYEGDVNDEIKIRSNGTFRKADTES